MQCWHTMQNNSRNCIKQSGQNIYLTQHYAPSVTQNTTSPPNCHWLKTLKSLTAIFKEGQNQPSRNLAKRHRSTTTRLVKLTMTRIILFNRRRVGEVSKMPLKNFLQRDEWYAFEELGLSTYEKRLCKYFRRVELKGKRGRKVAVLLTPDVTKASCWEAERMCCSTR